ncbi:MAG: hypothetical protein H6624_16360 [Bdellovibrionaceae bacterium]|nr:hypothetical protein [Pseudobdellovibrionaceae bacterium]
MARAATPSGEFIGYEAYANRIQSRIWNPDGPQFTVALLIGKLEYLFGGYQGFGVQNSYRNGKPSPQSFLVYHLAARKIANKVSSTCLKKTDGSSSSDFRVEFAALVQTFCRDAIGGNQLNEKLRSYWDFFMDSAAGDEEFARWAAHISSIRKDGRPSIQIVEDMTFTVLMNSHFLLRR